MAPFRGFGLSLTNEDDAGQTLALAEEADSLGFDEVSIPESRRFRSLFSIAGAVLARTYRTTVRVGIANPVTRHPIVLAMEAATLAELGPGRVRFGIGAAEWTVRRLGYADEDWRPYANTIESARAIRSLIRGETLGFSPTTFRALPDARLDFSPKAIPPLDLGAVNRRMMEAAGEIADGVQLGALTSVGYVSWAHRRIAAGAARAGRDPGGLLMAANVLTSVDRERSAARSAVREVLAYYLHRVEGVVIDQSGADPEAVEAVRATVASDGLPAGSRVLSDHLIDVFAVAGTVEDVITGLLPFADAGLHLPLAWYTFGPDRRWSIKALAREVRPAMVG
jgi:5,10-methylenetetrahydromethanopterin reductase